MSEKTIEERVSELEALAIANYKDLIRYIDRTLTQVNVQTPLLKNAVFKFLIGGAIIWLLILFFIFFRFKTFQKLNVEEKPKLEFLRFKNQPNPSMANLLNIVLPGISYLMIDQKEKACVHITQSLLNLFFIFWFLEPFIVMLSSDQPILLTIITLSTVLFFIITHVFHIYFVAQDSNELFSRICRGHPIVRGECCNKVVMLGIGDFIDVIDSQNPPQEYIDEMKKSEIGE